MTAPASRSMTDNETFEKAALQLELCTLCSWHHPECSSLCDCNKDLRCRNPRNGQTYVWRPLDLAFDCQRFGLDVELGNPPTECMAITATAIPCPHFRRASL